MSEDYRGETGPSEERVGWVFVPAFIFIAAILIWGLGCAPAQALEVPQCQPGYIHYPPLCLTEQEYLDIVSPPPPPVDPRPLHVALVAEYFPWWEVDEALWVIGCETGWTFDPWAYNTRSGASGYFQHMPRYWSSRSSAAGWAGYSIFDPEANVAVAAWLWGQTGTWAHWSCKP